MTSNELDALGDSKTVCPCCGQPLEVSPHFPVEITEHGDAIIVYLECPVYKGVWKLELPIPMTVELSKMEGSVNPKGRGDD